MQRKHQPMRGDCDRNTAFRRTAGVIAPDDPAVSPGPTTESTIMNDETARSILNELSALRAAVERISGPKPAKNDLEAADCFVWDPATAHLQPVETPNRIDISLIRGVDHVRDILVDKSIQEKNVFSQS